MSALRELLVVFGVKFDDSELKRGESTIDGMIGKLKGFGVALAGAFALGQVKDFVLGLAEQADTLRDHALALGTSVEELQAWHFAAGMAGVKAEEFNGALTKFSRNIAAAADSASGPAAKAFKELGVTVKDAGGNLGQPLDLINGVAAGLQNVQDPARRTALAMDLFGRSGAKLLPLLQEGPEGLAKFRAEVEELGGGISNEFADAADEMNDNLARLNLSTLSLKVRLAAFLLPAFEAVIRGATRFATWFRKLVEGTNITKAALIALGTVGVIKLSAMLGPLGALSKAFGKFALKVALPLLLLEDLATFLDGGDSLTGRALEKLFGEGTSAKVRQFFKDVKQSVKEFFDDLKNRPEKFLEDFRTFIFEVKKDLKEAFGPAGVAGLDGLLLVFDLIVGGWDNAINRISALTDALILVFDTKWMQIKFGAIEAAAAVADAFASAWNGILLGASNTIVKIGTALADIPGMTDAAKKVTLGGIGLLGGVADTNNAELARADRASAARGLLTRADGIKERLQTVNAPTVTTNVTVPPGTPTAQAKAVGKAAEQGAAKGMGTRASGPNRGAHAALVRKGK